MRADDAIEWRDDIGIAVVDRRDLGVDLSLLQVCLGVVARRGGGVEGRLRDGLPLHQIRLPFEVGFGLFHRRLCAGLGSLGLLKFQLVGIGLDCEQRRALLHEVAVLVVDRLQEPLHPRDEIDVLDGGGVAGSLEKARDRLLHRHADIDLRRWRRHKTILFACA